MKSKGRVNLTLLPNPEADSLKRELATSPTLLLAGIIYYLVKKNLGGGCTQLVITSKFGLKPKIVSLCITGKKYRGGKDTIKATKRKATDEHHGININRVRTSQLLLHKFVITTMSPSRQEVSQVSGG